MPLKRSQTYRARCRLPYVPYPLPLHDHMADGPADRPSEPGRIREPDKWIEGILFQRLTHIIQVWCAEFDRLDDSDTRRDFLPVRDVVSKRRRDKRMKEEKVSFFFFCCE